MRIAILTLLCVLCAAFFFPTQITDLSQPISERDVEDPITLLFVGDIMLARDVENYLDRNGGAYPFEKITELLKEPDAAIGNFEGIVSEPHVQTPIFTFQFSIRPEYLKSVYDVGFDILSLANNHSSDHGDNAVALTQMLCTEYGLRCAGSAEASEAFVYEIRGTRIGFLFANMTWNTESADVVARTMRELAKESDVQIAYVHWGTEYELMHNASQETLAHELIDAGADAIIGHHPHVVQDVDFYKSKPIFYSLGNFIFDQYWDPDVQIGLGVRMNIKEDEIHYETLPFTTQYSRVQPQLMDEEESRVLFQRIFNTTEIDAATFTVDRI